jgi:hypothetical protein
VTGMANSHTNESTPKWISGSHRAVHEMPARRRLSVVVTLESPCQSKRLVSADVLEAVGRVRTPSWSELLPIRSHFLAPPRTIHPNRLRGGRERRADHPPCAQCGRMGGRVLMDLKRPGSDGDSVVWFPFNPLGRAEPSRRPRTLLAGCRRAGRGAGSLGVRRI